MTVVIPNYNYARFLPEAIESVLAQSYRPLEVVVVDDGSTDGSQEILKRYGERIRWVTQQNQGVSEARNRGAHEARGELLAFLDADDVWLPAKLAAQVPRMFDDPEVGLVHCGVETMDVQGFFLGTHLDGREGWVAREMLLFEPVVIVPGSTSLVTREIFDSVGGFDTRLSTSADWDFCYGVAQRRRIAFVRQPLVRYRIHASNMHKQIHIMEREMVFAYRKAFDAKDPELRRLKRRAYGNLHMVLAGSYFRAGQAADFGRNAIKSLWFSPRNATRLLGFPVRAWRRWRENRRAGPG